MKNSSAISGMLTDNACRRDFRRSEHGTCCTFSASRGAGYTLLELLVVVGVIAVLSALAVPAYRAVQEKSMGAKDVSNLRQIGTALLSFAAENEGVFPVAGGVVALGQQDATTGRPSWVEQVQPYVHGATNIFVSPRAVVPEPRGQPALGYFLGSRAAVAADDLFGPVRLNRMESPSQTILAGVSGAQGMFESNDWDKDDYYQSPAFDESMNSRLPGKIAILFADGHVRDCEKFDTNSMTTEYVRGRWYSF